MNAYRVERRDSDSSASMVLLGISFQSMNKRVIFEVGRRFMSIFKFKYSNPLFENLINKP